MKIFCCRCCFFNFGGWGPKPFVKPNWQWGLGRGGYKYRHSAENQLNPFPDDPNNCREIARDVTTGMAESIKNLQS